MKRISGVDFKTEIVGRRPGDAETVVANADRARRELGWVPKHDDLDFIVRTALQWEDALTRRNQTDACRTFPHFPMALSLAASGGRT